MIVVTGATGVIGRALIARLNQERLPWLILDRQALARAGDLSLSSVVPRKPSSVIHLAAVVPKPPEVPDDELHAERTRQLDAQVLEAVKEWGCHVIYASGCSLYPKSGATPKREEEATGTHDVQSSPYLVAKAQGEQNYLASGRATVLRISAPLGEGLSPATIVGRFMKMAKSGGDLEVWGSGFREQNYVDVIDISDALLRSLIMRPPKLINIAADQPITMLNLAQEIVHACGSGSIHMTDKSDPRDGELARYSNQRAVELLGWHPMVSMYKSLERLSELY